MISAKHESTLAACAPDSVETDGTAANRTLDRTPETSVRVLGSLILAITDRFGEDAARRVLAEGELTIEMARAHAGWMSVEQQRRIFEAARSMLGSDEAFVEANGHRAREAFGPLAYLTWAARPGLMMDLAFRSMEFFSRIASGAVVERAPGYMRARYTSQVREPRLFCLARIGAMKALPTIWNLDAAEVRERACIALGHDACEYELRWREPLTHARTLLGAVLGLAAVALLWFFRGATAAMLYPVPLLAAALGFVAEARHRRAAEVRDAEELRKAIETLAREVEAARREFAELGARQREWLARVEHEVAEHRAGIERALATFAGRNADDEHLVRAVSHDLATPLMVLRTNLFSLRGADDPRAIVDDMFVKEQLNAVARVERLLRELAELESVERGAVREIVPSGIEVAELAERVARRLNAFVLGRAVHVSVSRAEQCPSRIETDVTWLDRVLDNLLSNAVKYTAEGSVSVVLGGVDELVIDITDTGRGIDAEQLPAVFEPGGSEPSLRAPGSRGIGLSVVKRLVHRLRGSLEVSSRPGGGTTFRVRLPLDVRCAPTNDEHRVVRLGGA